MGPNLGAISPSTLNPTRAGGRQGRRQWENWAIYPDAQHSRSAHFQAVSSCLLFIKYGISNL